MNCRDQTCRIGASGAGNIKRRAMVGRRAHKGKAKRDIHRMVESERLDRDQRLIMIHAQRGVIRLPRLCVKKRIRR